MVARNRREGRHQDEGGEDSTGEENESTLFIRQDQGDVEMAAMTPYTSTHALVSPVPQNYNYQDIEMTFITPHTHTELGVPTTSWNRQATESAAMTTHTSTTSIASTLRGSSTTLVKDTDNDNLLERNFAPSHLCFLTYDKDGKSVGYETRRVGDWVREHGDRSGTDYVFLSYTRKQFCVLTEGDFTDGKAPLEIREALL
ncbi:hypothetical protein PG994_011901 [Apiospora phragmitis]|uniref:Uncharacterized protein n=1 Tax=Apiospora phragmitis TaxID=2905665 RepID=A0ABR1TU37_9PEZI